MDSLNLAPKQTRNWHKSKRRQDTEEANGNLLQFVSLLCIDLKVLISLRSNNMDSLGDTKKSYYKFYPFSK